MLRCIRCRRDYPTPVPQCECGFRFDNVPPHELPAWFAEVSARLEAAYLPGETPWQQSGKGGDYAEWERGRRPIADCITASGSFLDIGCANGYLLECLPAWSPHPLIPYGLDTGPRLVALAQARLPAYRDHIFLGNGWDWQPPHRFDYVRTELVYVPANLQPAYVARLLEEFLTPNGRLLCAEYASSRLPHAGPWVDQLLAGWGYQVLESHAGFSHNGREITRIAVVVAG